MRQDSNSNPILDIDAAASRVAATIASMYHQTARARRVPSKDDQMWIDLALSSGADVARAIDVSSPDNGALASSRRENVLARDLSRLEARYRRVGRLLNLWVGDSRRARVMARVERRWCRLIDRVVAAHPELHERLSPLSARSRARVVDLVAYFKRVKHRDVETNLLYAPSRPIVTPARPVARERSA